jgi:hypothetical protein
MSTQFIDDDANVVVPDPTETLMPIIASKEQIECGPGQALTTIGQSTYSALDSSGAKCRFVDYSNYYLDESDVGYDAVAPWGEWIQKDTKWTYVYGTSTDGMYFGSKQGYVAVGIKKGAYPAPAPQTVMTGHSANEFVRYTSPLNDPNVYNPLITSTPLSSTPVTYTLKVKRIYKRMRGYH